MWNLKQVLKSSEESKSRTPSKHTEIRDLKIRPETRNLSPRQGFLIASGREG
jgi:hypothetical protein